MKMGLVIAAVALGLWAAAACGKDESGQVEGPDTGEPSATVTVIGTVGAGGALIGTPRSTAPRVGASAPDFSSRTPAGEPVALADFRGRPVLLNFWATWCGPCRTEMPHLEAVYREFADQQLALLAVNMNESPAAVQGFFDSLGLTFTPVLDPGLKTANRYGVFGLPTTFFIDRNGVIQFIKIGPFLTKQEIVDRLRLIL